MLTYTNHLKKLILPEYGRNIQQMVDHCLTIEDRAARTACAGAIVRAMTALFPNNTTDREGYLRKLWDHLFIMSDFRLDVDVPFEPVRPETFEGRPEPMPLPGHAKITFRHYGSIIEEMIAKAAEMPEGPERTELVYLIASQMKKSRLAIDRDGSDDERIFNDLHYLSKGAINVPRGAMVLAEYKAQAPQPAGKKRKKK
jgi:hypothetical protein